MFQFFYLFIFFLHTYMSNTTEPLRFVYGRWRIDTPEIESCVNIPEVEVGKQFSKMNRIKVEGRERCVKMSRMKRENDNVNLPRS